MNKGKYTCCRWGKKDQTNIPKEILSNKNDSRLRKATKGLMINSTPTFHYAIEIAII